MLDVPCASVCHLILLHTSDLKISMHNSYMDGSKVIDHIFKFCLEAEIFRLKALYLRH